MNTPSALRRCNSGPRTGRLSGFSLVELLVVMAIIALLIGIIMPALRRARLEAWRTVSIANLHSISQAGVAYQAEHKGAVPITPKGNPGSTYVNAWCTWGSWGKNTSSWWTAGVLFDINPARRPLNPYLTNADIPSATDAATRATFQVPVCRDPSDKIGHQRTWDAYDSSFGVALPNSDGSTCYDDVGTSYLTQMKWFFQTNRVVGGNWTRAFALGTARLRASDSFESSRMIWINDEYCDITMNQTSAAARITNGYGDINKAAVGFLDGHAKYINIIPGGESDPNAVLRPWLVPAYCNSEYTVVFPNLHP